MKSTYGAWTAPSTSTGPQLQSLQLINTDTNAVISPLTDGMTIDLNVTGDHLSIEARTDSGAESFRFTIDGSVRIENTPPYALFGNQNGNYNAWTPRLGLRQRRAGRRGAHSATRWVFGCAHKDTSENNEAIQLRSPVFENAHSTTSCFSIALSHHARSTRSNQASAPVNSATHIITIKQQEPLPQQLRLAHAARTLTKAAQKCVTKCASCGKSNAIGD